MAKREATVLFTDAVDWHARSLARAIKARGFDCVILSLRKAGFAIGERAPVSLPGLAGIRPAGAFVKGISAGSFEQVTLRLSVLHALSAEGCVVHNEAVAIERCVDKAMTSYRLARAGLPTPETWVSEDVEDARAIAARARDAGRILVLKPLFGAQGRGLMRIAGPDDLPAPETIAGVYYLQYLIEGGRGFRDWRVLVSNGVALAAMIRHGASWITNVYQGAECEGVPAEGEIARLAVEACAAVGASFAGVDIIEDRAGALYILEVNSMPAWKGLQGVTDVPLAERLAEDFLARVDAKGRG
jgi:tetrahydromethanopterin:alpha-L-glutamate ligase